ncbi:MAG: sigma-70 family RNA polymerase sigma factor [Chitinophagaceae bacterium]|nr:MAG: sigma-70 family RNA polymerase sigma factor [Chitinophagaceae bacterium]
MKTDLFHRNIETCINAFRQGEPNAIKFLFSAWYQPLCAYIASLIHHFDAAEEIASEAFVKTWHYRQQFFSTDEIRAYLFTIAKRDAFRWQQQQQRNRQVTMPDQLPAYPEPDHYYLIAHREILQLLHSAIKQLPPRCSQIFQLLYVQGKKTEEVARELAISPYTVRAQKARGLSLLRPKLLSFLKD